MNYDDLGWESGLYDKDDEEYQNYIQDLIDNRHAKQEHIDTFTNAGQMTFKSWGEEQEFVIPHKDVSLKCSMTIGYTENNVTFFLNGVYCSGSTFKEKKELISMLRDVQIDPAEFIAYKEKKKKMSEEISKEAIVLYNSVYDDPNEIAASYNRWNKLLSDLDFLKTYLDKKGSELQPQMIQALSKNFGNKVKWRKRKFESGIEDTPLYKNIKSMVKKSNKYRKAKVVFDLYGVDTSNAIEFKFCEFEYLIDPKEYKDTTMAVMKTKDSTIAIFNGEKMVLNRNDLDFSSITDFDRIKKEYANDIILCKKVEPIVKLPSLSPDGNLQSQTLKM